MNISAFVVAVDIGLNKRRYVLFTSDPLSCKLISWKALLAGHKNLNEVLFYFRGV